MEKLAGNTEAIPSLDKKLAEAPQKVEKFILNSPEVRQGAIGIVDGISGNIGESAFGKTVDNLINAADAHTALDLSELSAIAGDGLESLAVGILINIGAEVGKKVVSEACVLGKNLIGKAKETINESKETQINKGLTEQVDRRFDASYNPDEI